MIKAKTRPYRATLKRNDSMEPKRCAKMRRLLATISRMDTEAEVSVKTGGDGMASDDAVEALSRIIEEARRLLHEPEAP